MGALGTQVAFKPGFSPTRKGGLEPHCPLGDRLSSRDG